MAASGA